jgi:SHS2 domain-containing protein
VPFIERDHTADILMHVWGETTEDLFSEAAGALFSIMFPSCKPGDAHQSFSLSADSYEALLGEFLSEILYYAEVECEGYTSADVKIDGFTLEARLSGEPYDPARHAGGTEVKGISRSGMKIEKTTRGYETDILFDV